MHHIAAYKKLETTAQHMCENLTRIQRGIKQGRYFDNALTLT